MDQLELIKVEIITLLGMVDGLLHVHRDRGQLAAQDTETKIDLLPAAIFLDGKERPSEEDSGIQGQSRRGQMPPVTMYFEPEIHIILMPRLTPENEGIGEEMSNFRIKVHKALTRSRNLYSLLGTNGGITYLGYESDMQAGSDLRGQMRLDYRFAYVFDPSVL